MIKSIFAWCIAVFSIITVMAISLWFYATSPYSDNQSEIIYELHVPKGMSIKDVSKELQDKHIIKSWNFLYLAARFSIFDREKVFKLKSGVYDMKSSMSLKEVYMLLQTGTSADIRISIPEGLTITKTALELEKANICSADDFTKACYNVETLEKYAERKGYSVPEGKNLEGFLFPDTYFFTEGMTMESIIAKFLDNFFDKVSEVKSLKGKTPEEFYKILILASIIEREYRIPEEAPIIASVFVNRINNNIGLYSCATIEYILTEIQGLPHPEKITYADLKIDSPYNTYKWASLPPGPISNPGLISIKAAAEPEKTDFYYFVLTEPTTGKHTFSKNFNQHIQAENLYTKKTPAKK